MTQTPLLAVTGRFQPFHTDHLDLVLRAASDCYQLIVGITNPDIRSLVPDSASVHRHRKDANPFTYFERHSMITGALTQAGLSRDRFAIVPFPLDAPESWPSYVPLHFAQLVRTFAKWENKKVEILRAGGYQVRAIPGDLRSRICASDIRAAMAAGADWRKHVPAGTQEFLSTIGDEELALRCATDAVGA